MHKMKPASPGGSINIGGQMFLPDEDGVVTFPTVEHVKIARSHGFTDAPPPEAKKATAPQHPAAAMNGAEVAAYIKANKIEVPPGAKLAEQRVLVKAHMDEAAEAES